MMVEGASRHDELTIVTWVRARKEADCDESYPWTYHAFRKSNKQVINDENVKARLVFAWEREI
jgi:hypothetical protein